MSTGPEIRDSGPDDSAAIGALYAAAFPDEDLLPLVGELLQDGALALSLVATVGACLAGHAVFTRCDIEEDGQAVALLGPLAVAPARQRQGIGSALVRAGLKRLRHAGVAAVYVLGDPGYYGRLGFAPETAVAPPYPLPADWRGAWQSICLAEGTSPPRRPPPGLRRGSLCVPQPWRRPALWAP